MSTIATNNITDAAGSGAPNFANGLKLGTAGVLGPVTGDAPMYACRAWVNFNGTGTVAIRASGNVSSITDNGTGVYTVNFTTAMPDANYSATVTLSLLAAGTSPNSYNLAGVSAFNTASMQVNSYFAHTTGGADASYVNVAIFR